MVPPLKLDQIKVIAKDECWEITSVLLDGVSWQMEATPENIQFIMNI